MTPNSDTGTVGQGDPTLVPLSNGLLAKNCEFFGDGSVITRFGNSRVFLPTDNVRSMINWLPIVSGAPQNLLVWLAQGTGVKLTSLASPGAGTTIMTQATAVAASFQPQGARLYAGFMNANGIGVAAGQVYDRTLGVADPLFAPPMTTVPVVTTAVNIGSLLTPGAKNFGYMVKTRTGFISLPSPVTSTSNNTFVPVTYTVGPTDSVVQIQLAATWPSYASGIFLVCTTTANPNQYFIIPAAGSADGSYPVTGGTSTTLNMFLASVTDDYITNNYLDASQYFNQLSQTIAGTSPLNPSVIFSYGQRMCYVALDENGVSCLFVSDPGNPQSVNAAFGRVYLPGNVTITTAYALGRTLYIEGPHWTYSTTDNNGLPSTWAQPEQVDGLIGTVGPFGVSVVASQTYAWIADDTGFWLFSGAFPDRPVSYYQQGDWNRINFGQPAKIFVVDDKANLRVHVYAPLDGATDITHRLTWDYSLRASDSAGINIAPEQVKYSLDDFQSYTPGAACIVQSNTARRSEVWMGSTNTGQYVLRQNGSSDTNPYRDDTAAVDSKYQTALLPKGSNIGQVYQHHGDHIRATGSVARLTAYALDGSVSAGPFTLAVSALPAAEILQQYYLLSEGCSVQLDNGNVVDGWFKWAGATHYYTDSFPQR